MNVVIIDSGISTNIELNVQYEGISVVKGGKIEKNYEDTVGHGSALAQLFAGNIEKSDLVKIYIIKIENNTANGYDLDLLLYALDYVKESVPCDLLIISSGIRLYNQLLYDKLDYLNENGVLIFSAFDNYGSMSYPAAFDFVIGVDVSDDVELHGNELIALLNNAINIIVKNRTYRVKWINGSMNIISGASFACAYVAGLFANHFLNNKEQNIHQGYVNFISDFSSKIIDNRVSDRKNSIENVKKAIVFPFTKEVHSLAMNEELVKFEILDYYDIRQSGKIGIEIKKLLRNCDNAKIIKNLDNIDWDGDFDTFILSYCDKYGRILSCDVKKYIIEKCREHDKFLISFDSLDGYEVDGLDCYYPFVDVNDTLPYNFGKMYMISAPVLGIFGTGSKQGKFTLQLMLRKIFKEEGYAVAQVGTEPSSLLFGMDYVFPMGYNSTVYTKSNDNISILNKFMNGCDIKNPDIIIVGAQSGTCPYNIFNINLFTLPQIEFLMGTQPDIVVLTVNVNDDLEYVRRTVKTIEGIVDCKVISFVLFPRRMAAKIEMISSVVSDEEYLKYEELLEETFDLPVFSLDNADINLLYEYIVDFLS